MRCVRRGRDGGIVVSWGEYALLGAVRPMEVLESSTTVHAVAMPCDGKFHAKGGAVHEANGECEAQMAPVVLRRGPRLHCIAGGWRVLRLACSPQRHLN